MTTEALKAALEDLDASCEQWIGTVAANGAMSGYVSALFKAKLGAALAALAEQQAETSAIEAELPHAYLFAKLAMVMPLFQEARDALTAITELQRVAHRISSTLADRMDTAGTYSIDDWNAAQQ
jgi:hypothetical protein